MQLVKLEGFVPVAGLVRSNSPVLVGVPRQLRARPQRPQEIRPDTIRLVLWALLVLRTLRGNLVILILDTRQKFWLFRDLPVDILSVVLLNVVRQRVRRIFVLVLESRHRLVSKSWGR